MTRLAHPAHIQGAFRNWSSRFSYGRNLLSAAASLLILLTAQGSLAECTPAANEVQSGQSVICSENSLQYTVPGPVEDLTVVIEPGATFDQGVGAVSLGNFGRIENGSALIEVNIPGNVGFTAGEDSSLENQTVIENTSDGVITLNSPNTIGVLIDSTSKAINGGVVAVKGELSVGIRTGTVSRVELNAGSLIEVEGNNSIGVQAGDGSETLSFEGASLVVSGQGAIGVAGGQLFQNEGDIELSGSDSTGASLLTSLSEITHAGSATVTATGAGSTVFELNEESTFGLSDPPAESVFGTITLDGENSVGVSAGIASKIYHRGTLTSSADGTTGLRVSGDDQSEATGFAVNHGSMTFTGQNVTGITAGLNQSGRNSTEGVMLFEGASSTAVQSGDGESGSFNLGTITMQGDNSTAVLSGNGGGELTATRVSNTGVITLSGDNSFGLRTGDYGNIDNFGEISLDSANGTAVRAGTESRVINNGGVITLSGEGARGIWVDGSTLPERADPALDQVFVNVRGGILESTNPLAGPLIFLEPASDPETRVNTVFNTGFNIEDETPSRITANTDALDASLDLGVAIKGSSTDDRIVNAAIITGLVLLGEGDDIYETRSNGQLTDLGEGTVDGGAGTDAIELNNDIRQEGLFFDVSPFLNFEEIRISDGTWQLRGTQGRSPSEETDLLISNRGTLSLIEPIIVSGDYSHGAPGEDGSKARVEVILTTDAQGQTLLQVQGSADLENGELSVSLSPSFFESGTFTILEAEERTGEFDSITLPTGSGAQDSQYQYTSRGLEVTLLLQPLNANQTATANYLNALPTSGLSPGMTSLLTTVREDLTYSEYLGALDRLMPEAYDAQADATLQLANQYTDLLLSRPNYCVAESNQASTDPETGQRCHPRPFEPWINLYGQKRKRTGTEGHISYRDEGGGVIVGLDHRVNPQLLLTASAGAAYDIIHVENIGKGRLGTVDIGFAASWAQGPLRIQGAASYGYGWNQRYREVDFQGFNATTQAKYGMNRVGLRARAEYAFRLGRIQIAPLASVDYTALMRPSITENGGGAADLYIEEATNNITTVRVGFDLSSALHKQGYWTEILENADGVWRPQLRIAWRQVVTGAHRDITSRFSQIAGSTFTIQADAADRGFEVGAGIDWSPALINRFTFGVHYDAFVWENVLNQTLMGQVRFSF